MFKVDQKVRIILNMTKDKKWDTLIGKVGTISYVFYAIYKDFSNQYTVNLGNGLELNFLDDELESAE